MNPIHTNGHAALHVMPLRIPRLVDMQVDLSRPAGISTRKARPTGGEAKPQPNEPTVTPTPPTADPGAPGKGNRQGRKPAKQTPARKEVTVAPHRPKVAKKGGHTAGKANAGNPRRQSQPEATGGEGTKKAQVLVLLRRSQGATLAELVEATGWQSHSVRGFLSGAIGKRMKLKVKSGKRADGIRVYSVRS